MKSKVSISVDQLIKELGYDAVDLPEGGKYQKAEKPCPTCGEEIEYEPSYVISDVVWYICACDILVEEESKENTA